MIPKFDAEAVGKISMLSPAILSRIHNLAAASEGAVLEVGPYIGGSTVAIASAGHRVITIEMGGAHDNPGLPSADILGDLRRNLARFEVADRVTIVPELADQAYDRLPELLDAPIGLLFIDADGHLGAHMTRLAPHLRADCALVFDDYSDELKGPPVQRYIEAALQAGAMVEDGVQEGTWFGRMRDAAALPHWPHKQEVGCSWELRTSLGGADNMTDPACSMVQLFENDQELGPPHSLHSDIRELGGGRFSHWHNGNREVFLFSTSDGSDPNSNGRVYTVDAGEGRRLLAPRGH